MMKPHLVFVSCVPFTNKIKSELYTDELISHGVNLEYWDLTEYFSYVTTMIPGILSRDYIKYIGNRQELKSNIKRIQKKGTGSRYLIYMALDWNSIGVYRTLMKHGCRMDYFSTGHYPAADCYSRNIGIYGIIRRILNDYSYLKTLVGNYILYLLKKTGFIRRWDNVFVAGDYARRMHVDISRLIPFHHFDYDRAVPDKNEVRAVANEYIVFLDCYFAGHPDFKLLNLPTLNPERYYHSVSCFFDKIEAIFHMPVVIAAHPKAKYNAGEYGERSIFYGKARNLVEHCSLVISHHSNSVSYAVLYEKPIIFITSDQINALYERTYACYAEKFSHFLKAPLMNIDHDDLSMLDQSHLKIDKEAYRNYKYEYLVSKSNEHRTNTDILVKEYGIGLKD